MRSRCCWRGFPVQGWGREDQAPVFGGVVEGEGFLTGGESEAEGVLVGAAEEVRGGLGESGAMGANDEFLGGEVDGAGVGCQLRSELRWGGLK